MIAKRFEFRHFRQRLGESVMQYMGMYQQLLQFAGGVLDTNTDLVHFFYKGLLPAIGGIVVTTEPKRLDRANEHSLVKEAYLIKHLEDGALRSVETQIEQRSERMSLQDM
ncbi:hypothetical protein Scep_004881 [Stephania cephalantha]|uniref:Uncharacterized protein n=1 Tax=Stephania cephalantha TaxID=152367 RepID=A0AAP0KT93_9MAGN